MTDVSEFLEESRVKRQPCSVRTLLDDLDEVDPDRAAKLRAALDNPGITSAAIERVLTRWEVSIKAPTVGRHRKGACSCGD